MQINICHLTSLALQVSGLDLVLDTTAFSSQPDSFNVDCISKIDKVKQEITTKIAFLEHLEIIVQSAQSAINLRVMNTPSTSAALSSSSSAAIGLTAPPENHTGVQNLPLLLQALTEQELFQRFDTEPIGSECALPTDSADAMSSDSTHVTGSVIAQNAYTGIKNIMSPLRPLPEQE